MSDTLIHYFNNELSYLREQGQQFAKAYPDLGNQLQLNNPDEADPLVERLLEGFAFLTGRVQHKIDCETDVVSQNLINQLFPQMRLPMPACSIVECRPNQQLDKAYSLPRHTALKNEGCYFRTAYQTTILPYDIDQTQLLKGNANDKSILTIKLKPFTENVINTSLANQSLRFYINLEPYLANQFYEMIFNQLLTISINGVTLDKSQLKPVGFSQKQSLHDASKNTFTPYLLLNEYFYYPNKFMFFDIELPNDSAIFESKSLILTLKFNQFNQKLAHSMSNNSLKLNCTPIVNLFEKQAEPIHIDYTKNAYPIVADQLQPDLIVYRALTITAQSSDTPDIQCCPYFDYPHNIQSNTETLYWQTSIKPKWQQGRYRQAGFDNFLIISTENTKANVSTIIVTPHVLCSNAQKQLDTLSATSTFDFCQTTHDCIESIKLCAPISKPIFQELLEKSDAKCVAHLLQRTIIGDDNIDTLKNIKNLFGFYYNAKANAQRIENSFVNLNTTSKIIRYPDNLHCGFCQETELTLEINEDLFPTPYLFLFGSVIQHFLTLTCAINSFVCFRLASAQRGTIKTWQPLLGKQSLL